MENLNKVFSFALGLVVVVIFLAIISGKIDIRKKIPLLSQTTTQKTVSPTPTPTPTTTSIRPKPTTYTNYQDKTTINKTYNVKTIPATGSPTILLPVFFSFLSSGLYLRRKK